MAKVRKLHEHESAACEKAAKIYEEKSESLNLTHLRLAERLGFKTSAAVTQILRGYRALTLDLLLGFCEVLQVHPKEICPIMSSRIERVFCAYCPYDK